MTTDSRVLPLLLAGVGALFLLMDAGGVVSAGSTLAVVAYWLLGRCLLERVVGRGSVDVLGFSAAAVIVGIALQVGASLLLQPFIPWQLTTGAILIGALAIGSLRNRGSLIPHRGQWPSTTSSKSVVGVIGVSFLYLGRDFRWANVAFVGACAIALGLFSRANRTLRIVLGCVGVAIVVLAVVSRTQYWWFVTNDHQWFEAIGQTTIAFGPNDVLGANATLGYQYHFLTYAWTAGLGSILHAQEFVILARVAPVLCAVLLSVTVWSLLGRLKNVSYPVRFLVAGCLPLLFDYSYTSPSHVFGMAQLIMLMWLLTGPIVKAQPAFGIALGVLLGLSLALTKVSAAPPAVLGAASVVIIAHLQRDSDRWQRSALGFGVVFSVGAYVLTQLLNSRTSRQANTSVVFGFARERTADLQQLGYGPGGILASLLVTSAFILPPVAAVFLFRRRVSLDFDDRLLWFSLPSIPYVCLLAVASGNFSIGYFVTSGIYVLYVPMLCVMADTLERRARRFQLLGFLGTSCLIGLGIERLRPFVNGGTDREVVIRSLLYAYWIPAFVIVFAAAAILRMRRSKIYRPASLMSSAVTLSVMIAVSVSVMNVDRLSKGPDLKDSESAIAVGRADQRDVGEWLRTNLPVDAVIASNHFCGEQCTGSDWFARDVSLMGDGFQLGRTPTGYGGSDFFLVIYSNRRFLVQSPTYLLTAGVPPELLADRIDASTQFADDPGAATLARLRELDVSYFVVDKRSTTVRDYSRVGEVVHENSGFIVVRLDTRRA